MEINIPRLPAAADLLQLPTELLGDIITRIDEADQLALYRTCRRACDMILPRIGATTIALPEPGHEEEEGGPGDGPTLQRFPRRATLHRMRINVHVADGEQQPQQAPMLLATLSSVAARLSELKSLTIGWADEHAVMDPWDKRQDFSAELASKIARDCSSLLRLNIRRMYLDSLRGLEPLAQLKNLESLHLTLPPPPFDGDRDLAEAEVSALGALTRLKELYLHYRYNTDTICDSDGAKKLDALLPAVARLRNLQHLSLTDRERRGGMPMFGMVLEVGAVSCLLSLQHLTSLAWATPDSGSSEWRAGTMAFEATCSLSQLVQLNLASYVISHDPHIELLASMPYLKQLFVKRLAPTKPVLVCRCAWEYVWFNSTSHTALARLPLVEVQRIDFTPKDGALSCVCFEFGGPDDGPDAEDILIAAAKALARACTDDLDVRLTWKDEEGGYAYVDASSCILNALAPLGGIVVRLSLNNFAVRVGTLAGLSSVFPRMNVLDLHDSSIIY